ncbi:MAG: hypothetical protein L6R42_007960 [Xanthoria sp. 1 TBL-2021]|nr:MAG: hypothetical protein L6R42_007960 [Xanthoria sp. 1 TBL-2021]
MSKNSKDALQICVAYVSERLRHHNENMKNDPFFLGVNGVQGIGKSYLVASLAHELEQAPHDIRTIVLSIDDFYLTHEDQVQLAADHSENPLVQHRGQPSTHDLSLALSVVASIRAKQETSIPSYEKSAFNGKGDRKLQTQWTNVNKNGQQPVQLVILEGWCVGFRALDDTQLTALWTDALKQSTQGNSYRGRLGHNRLENVHFINEALRGYDSLTDQLDALIHLDAEHPQYVYEWRLEQEDQLRRERGSGMTNAEVMIFVDGYYPSYELFTDRLRSGAFENRDGAQLRLVIRKDRQVKEVMEL